MKILHVIDSGGLYGAEIMLLNLLAEQVRMGLQAEIISIGNKRIKEKPFEAAAVRKGFAVHKIRMHSGPNWAAALSIAKFAAKRKFDILHSHGYKGNILFGFLPRIRRLPMVSTIHGWTAARGFSRMNLYGWLDRISLLFIDAVVVVNQAMLEHPGLKKPARIHARVVNNGISPDCPSFAETIDPVIARFCKDGFVIGAFGRLSPEKGIDHLIEACGVLLKQSRQVRLLIIGEGRQRSLLENKIKMAGLSDYVLLPGYRKDAAQYLSLLDVLALPSLTEGLPIIILEAMRAGVPIVASRVGGVPDVLEHRKNALLVAPADPIDLATAIRTLMDQPSLRSHLSNEAMKKFKARYTGEQMAAGYLRIYQEVLSSSSATSLPTMHPQQAKMMRKGGKCRVSYL